MVEIYKLANFLKLKMGVRYQNQSEGFLPTEAIQEADKLIEEMRAQFPPMIVKHLQDISALWQTMKGMPNSPEREEVSQKIFTMAHEIKDMGSMCGYELITHFAESLRDYIGRTDLNLKAQVVIIQAHMDAMQIITRQGVEKPAGPEAEELKKMVRAAVEKYS